MTVRRRLCTECGAVIFGTSRRCADCARRRSIDTKNTPKNERARHERQKLAGRDTKHWRRIAVLTKARDGYRCVDCGTTEDLTVDLVNPELGGDHRLATVDDCETRCRRCHGLRHARERR